MDLAQRLLDAHTRFQVEQLRGGSFRALVEDEETFHPQAIATLRALRTGVAVTAQDALALLHRIGRPA